MEPGEESAQRGAMAPFSTSGPQNGQPEDTTGAMQVASVISHRGPERTFGWGVIVNGEVKVQKVSDGVNDQTVCLVMSA